MAPRADVLGRSLSNRQVDAGSCNGCELEIDALNNAFYDLQRFGLRFVASPRDADVLMVTARDQNMREALQRTYNATPDPNGSSRFGDCALDGEISPKATRCPAQQRGAGRSSHRGCPPRPVDC